jgi:hypothetical protein
MAAGYYTLTAIAYDDMANQLTSAPVLINVGMPNLVLSNLNSCPNPLNATVTLNATFKDGSGNAIVGTNVSFTVTGANPTNRTVATSGSGVASFTYAGINSGVDHIVASAIFGGQTNTSKTVEQDWAYYIGCNQILSGILTNTSGTSSHGGRADFYSFSGQSNELVLISLTSTNFYTFLALRDTNCSLLATNDGYYWIGAQIACRLPADCTYVIEATSSLPQQTGAYVLELDCNTTNSAGMAVLQGTQIIPNYGMVDFGTTTTGTNVSLTLTITNQGNGSLSLGALTVSGDFTNTSQPTTPIAAGSSTSFNLRFNATSNGIANGTLAFGNNAAGSGINPFILNLTGVGNPSGTASTALLSS